MKVLSFLNVSNREALGADSGVIFHRLLFERLARQGIECVIAAPADLEVSGAHFVQFEPGHSKYDVRFRFDWANISALLATEKPSIVFVNQVELVSNFRALFAGNAASPRLITYCHYWPILTCTEDSISWDPSLNNNGLAEVILLRILAAAKTADIFFVTSEYARNLLIQSSNRYNVKIDLDRVVVLNCPADPDFIVDRARGFTGSKTVLYNHRLYQQYGTDFFIDIVRSLQGEGFRFIVTDFLGERNAARRALDSSVDDYRVALRQLEDVVLRTDGHIREIYRTQIVGQANIGLAPYRVNANWSMSAVDCMGVGVPVIAPRIASFPEFIPSSLLFETRDEALNLLRRLGNDKHFWMARSEEAIGRARRFTADITCSIFLNAIRAL